jgi:arylsulfatase
MVAEIEHDGGDGALIARGSINSGYALFIRQGRLHFDYNCFHDHTAVSASEKLSSGKHEVGALIERQEDGSGKVTLTVDGKNVGETRIPQLLLLISSLGMDLGRSLSPVCDDYAPPFVYPGRIARVIFEMPKARHEAAAGNADRAAVRAAMARQ